MPKEISIGTLSIGTLYSYIFDGIKWYNSDQDDSAKSEKKKLTQAQFEKVLNSKSEHFRYSLRMLQAKDLEEVLYGNSTDPLIKPTDFLDSLLFPKDEKIGEIFDSLNQKYKYFTKNQEDLAKKHFIILFKGTKLIGDYFENNNDEENSLAAENAYKILVWFGLKKGRGSPFSMFEKHLKLFPDLVKPVHDSLVSPIPVNNKSNLDLSGWVTFIKKYPVQGIHYFQQAANIEEMNDNRAPATIAEAQILAAKIVYPNASKHPEMAALFYANKLDNNLFNQCLELEKRRKSTDNLPDIHINGNTINFPEYHLVKLPIDDLRAYFLGLLTACCQSIGGHSERCVIDGITLPNNGFYVMLKGSKQSNPLIDNKINYSDFQIVGQGYAWISSNNNLVFDSWENLRASDNEIAVQLLESFSKELTQRDENIVRVTIGTGGKTPDKFGNKVLEKAEKMKEGYQYSDSLNQYLVYLDNNKLKTWQKALLDDWDSLVEKPLPLTTQEFANYLGLDNIYSKETFDSIATYLIDKKNFSLWINWEKPEKQPLPEDFWYILNRIENLNTEIVTQLLHFGEKDLSDLSEAIVNLTSLNQYNSKKEYELINTPNYASKVNQVFRFSNKLNCPEIFDLFEPWFTETSHTFFNADINYGHLLNKLQRFQINALSKTVIQELISLGRKGNTLLDLLEKYRSVLNIEQHLFCISLVRNEGIDVAEAYIFLYSKNFATEENIGVILAHPENALTLAQGLYGLSTNKILTPGNISNLIAYPLLGESLIYCNSINQKFFDCLIPHENTTENYFIALTILAKSRALTLDNVASLQKNPLFADEIVRIPEDSRNLPKTVWQLMHKHLGDREYLNNLILLTKDVNEYTNQFNNALEGDYDVYEFEPVCKAMDVLNTLSKYLSGELQDLSEELIVNSDLPAEMNLPEKYKKIMDSFTKFIKTHNDVIMSLGQESLGSTMSP
ncbi:hypothetical protein DGG96_19315 [Legionella qingyii]|uniref:Uncharacterized protein n=1 Tax=Legionella qingyii TaxID=2184757 RepID=A0A317U0I1_9GAMM|nr:hypothetical protein [Legionella qingyii]PWY53992.1 hypothetical protein DGG96_19315 [Legionella qingyii]RUR18979.1 hypothetical protein ELY20_16190 [Legionella qingyii]RUR21742.1 hypothetical protein ELY16_15830 [Legionella qingyii]